MKGFVLENSVRVFAPATVANLGPGFDILGLALDAPGDIVRATLSKNVGTTISGINGDGGKLPLETEKNTAGVAAEFIRKQIAPNKGVDLFIEKGLPLSSGLGSSAASAVAAAVAVNILFGNPLSKHELIPALLEAEALVSGYHLDNVAPCLFGGITLSAGIRAEDVHILPLGERFCNELRFVMVSPHVELPTVKARQVLPETVPFFAAVKQTGAVARLMYAIYADDLELLGRAMSDEQFVHQARAALIPLYNDVAEKTQNFAALSTIISGGGPTICIPVSNATDVEGLIACIKNLYCDVVPISLRIASINAQGAYVLPDKT